jgi:hypothetical protein
MKKILFILLLVPLFAISQTSQRVTISKLDIGKMNCKHEIYMNGSDTMNYIWLGFQNDKYTQITDTRSVMFPISKDSTDVRQFISDLKQAINNAGSKQNLSWERSRYSIGVSDYDDFITIYEAKSKGTGYTELKKEWAAELVKWLETCLVN